MAKIENVPRLLAKFRDLGNRARADRNVSVSVGYTAQYAIYQHENLNYFHRVGNAKFLTRPLRQLSRLWVQIVSQALMAGRTMGQALLLVGLRLQRESQLQVPVDTGYLRSSAFTRRD